MHLGRDVAVGVELLDGGLHEHGLPVTGRIDLVGNQLHALDDATAAHLKDLDDGAGRTQLHAEGVAVA